MTSPQSPAGLTECTEQKRLNDAREKGIPWKKWGPYLSERQWGTVREDYSADGNAWDYFTHDQSRSRAYRWGEDGLGGISDDKQLLCFALALWNGKDPILKERLFGLTNSEGNHGEDVKEYYFYVDSTPTHSYMKSLYKYPQREFPYRDLLETNRRRSREEMEYELLDTGAFHEDRYFDVFLEFAKEGPEDLLIRVSVHNRGPGAGAAPSPPDALVPEHVVVGRRQRAAAPRGSGAGEDSRGASRAGHVHARLRRDSGAPLHGEREQRRAPLGTAQRDPVREGRVPPVRRRRRDGRRESREGRHQGRGPVRPRRAGGRVRGRPAAPRGRAADAGVRQGVRRDRRRASRRRGRVLREDHAALPDRGRAPGPPAGARGNALVEAVLLLRRGPLAQRARRAPAPREPDGDPERRVVPHVQRRRHLDARQVGVPLVRGVGPRVPHALVVARRLRLRQAAAPPDAREPLRPPERADPGLRVELQRREPPRPRLGDVLPLPGRARPRAGGHQVPRALLPGAAPQLQLVGEPEGPRRAERLRRRLPRPRQHRRLRPERAAPDRRLARAGGRDGLDGLLLPEHARDRAHPGRARPRVRGARLPVPPALHLDLVRDGPYRRAPRRDVGRSGRVLLRPPEAAGRERDAPQGPVDGRAPAPLRLDGLRGRRPRAVPEAARADRALPKAPPRGRRARRADRRRGSSATRTADSSRS